MRSDRESARTPWSRPLLFAFILACHAVLILLAQRGLIHVPHPAEEPLTIFSVLKRPPPNAPPRTPPPSSPPRAHSAASLAAKAPTPGNLSTTTPAPSSPLDIDWSAEAAIAAQHQTALAAAPGPRSLDDHHGRKPLAGLNSSGPYQFGWDYAATHRVETSQGLPIIHLSDRCVVGFLLILPFFGCGFGGEIPVNGDLFKHMHDGPAESVPTPP
jgi:hypothetical protein